MKVYEASEVNEMFCEVVESYATLRNLRYKIQTWPNQTDAAVVDKDLFRPIRINVTRTAVNNEYIKVAYMKKI